jgi:hypothetical protein
MRSDDDRTRGIEDRRRAGARAGGRAADPDRSNLNRRRPSRVAPGEAPKPASSPTPLRDGHHASPCLRAHDGRREIDDEAQGISTEFASGCRTREGAPALFKRCAARPGFADPAEAGRRRARCRASVHHQRIIAAARWAPAANTAVQPNPLRAASPARGWAGQQSVVLLPPVSPPGDHHPAVPDVAPAVPRPSAAFPVVTARLRLHQGSKV